MFPTRYGKLVDFFNPSVSMIDVRDITFSLSHVCRFNGHSKLHYSVAQHSILVAKPFDDPKDKLYALLHDAHESYTGDLTSPFKHYLNTVHPDIVKTVEDKLDGVIHAYFGLEYPLPIELKKAIKEYDKRALATEVRDLTKDKHAQALAVVTPLPEPFDEILVPQTPKKARKVFYGQIMDCLTAL